MGYSVLQSASGHTVAGTLSYGIPYVTANLTAGTKLIAVVVNDLNRSVPTSVRDGASNDFTMIADLNDGGAAGHLSVWALDTPAGDAGTKPTITATCGTSGNIGILLQEVSGLATGTTIAAMCDGAPGTTSGNSTGNLGPPSYASTGAGEYLLYVYGDDGPGAYTLTKPAAYTLDTASWGSTGQCNASAAWKDSTGGTETGQWNLSVTASWALVLVAFKLAGGTPFTATPGSADGAGAAQDAAGAAGAATAALYAGSATGISGSWTNTGNAAGSGQGTYATWTDTAAGTSAVLELAGFGAQAPVPPGSTVTQVNCVVRHGEAPATSVASVTAQAYSGTSPVGSPQPLTAADAVHDDAVTFTGLAWADLADLRVRVTVTRN